MRFLGKNRKPLPLAILLALVVVASVALAAAALYEVSWWTADGGGVQGLSGGAYRLGATAGQHDAGRLAGGPYVLNGGFWAATLSPGYTRAARWELYR